MPTLVEPTGDPKIDGLLWGYKWDMTHLTVRFPVAPDEYWAGGYGNIQGFQAFNETQANEILLALNNLSVFTNLTFEYDFNFGGGNLRFAQADFIRYTPTSEPKRPGNNSAEGNPPDDNFSPRHAQGDTWYSNGAYETPQFGNFQRAAGLMHEIGHALGLKHGHHTQNLDGRDWPALPAEFDSQEYSIMTYRAYIGQDFNDFPEGDLEYPWTYQMLDIQALQYMYGANYGEGANNGDSTYMFNRETGEFSVDGHGFGPSYNASILVTMWDGGGNDTYDFTNHSEDQRIDLAPGAYSTFSQEQVAHLGDGRFARGNIANALLFEGDPRSLIENVKTGSGNDTISGNQAGNRLEGNGGNDTISGLGAADTLIGGAGDDTLDGGANPDGGGDVMLGGEGNDTYHVDHALDFVDEGNFAEYRSFGFGGIDTIVSTADFFWDFYSIGETLRIAETVVDAGGDGVTGVGSVFANTMLGHSGTDILFGRGGSDTYRAGDGVDWMSLSTLGVPDAEGYTANGNNTVIVEPRSSGPFSYDIVFEFETGKDRLDVSAYAAINGFTSGADVMARGVNVDFDGDGTLTGPNDSSYFILGDGLDYLYMVGTTLSEISPSDFTV